MTATQIRPVIKQELQPQPIHAVGSVISLTKYAKITGNMGKTLYVTDLHSGGAFQIIGDDLQEGCMSADKFSETQKVSKTELAEKLVESYGRPFTVTFEKANGKERVLRGRLLSSESILGRSTVEDLDKPDGDRIRLVDHRTLSSLVIDNIKFVLK